VAFGEGVVVGDLLALLDVAQRHQLVVALCVPRSRVSKPAPTTSNTFALLLFINVVDSVREEARTMYQALPSQVWLT
jgi:hypothetical protein